MSLTLRLTLTYLLITLSGLLVLGFGFTTLAERSTVQQRERILTSQADVYARYIAELARTPAELQSLAPTLSESGVLLPEVRVRVFALNGTLLSQTNNLGPFPSRPVLRLTDSPIPLPVSQSPNRRYTARVIAGNGTPIGIIELSHSTEDEQKLQHDLRVLVVQSALLAAGVVTIVSLLVARSIARPVARLTTHAESLASGSASSGERFLPIRPPEPSRLSHHARTTPPATAQERPKSKDEIVLLAQSLDHMAHQLQERIAETEHERMRLGVVLATISEGVIALDDDGQLLFANPAASALVNVETSAEIVTRLVDIGLPLQSATYAEREIQLDQRQLLVTIHPVRDSVSPDDRNMQIAQPEAADVVGLTPPPVPAVVFVVRDITQLKALEQARTRFFRSISHDLRTPLTAIRGMLENMRDVAPQDQQEAIHSIENEASRLARLVNELLHPSANGALLLTERRPVDMSTLVRELCALQQGRARRAGLTLVCHVQPDLPSIYGDRDRLKQTVLNLLDNAMRVTPAGGTISVEVTIIEDEQTGRTTCIRLSVADTGPGVPAALRERIWERGVRGSDFAYAYPSDEDGGSGLGLAIVREIAVAHGGWAWVEDNSPQGARFILDVPIITATFHAT